MKITIQNSTDAAGAFDDYVGAKMSPLAKFVKRFDETNEPELSVEISKTSKSHRNGEVFKVVANLALPHKSLRAEEYSDDVRTAIDQARNTLRAEIDKYKTQFVALDKKKLAK